MSQGITACPKQTTPTCTQVECVLSLETNPTTPWLGFSHAWIQELGIAPAKAQHYQLRRFGILSNQGYSEGRTELVMLVIDGYLSGEGCRGRDWARRRKPSAHGDGLSPVKKRGRKEYCGSECSGGLRKTSKESVVQDCPWRIQCVTRVPALALSLCSITDQYRNNANCCICVVVLI